MRVVTNTSCIAGLLLREGGKGEREGKYREGEEGGREGERREGEREGEEGREGRKRGEV